MAALAVDLPRDARLAAVLHSLAAQEALKEDWDRLVLRIPDDCFVATDTLAFLCAWGLRQRRAGRAVSFAGTEDGLRYLSRMDLFRHLDMTFDERFKRHPEVARFVPLQLIDGEESELKAVDSVANLVLHQFENGRQFLPALEWCLNEVVSNVVTHSETPTPGVVCAQYYPEAERIDLSVCDMGVGIRATVSQAVKVWSHGDAVTKALERGFTRDPEVGQGNGLAGSLEILRLNGGYFGLWTGDVLYRAEADREPGFVTFRAEAPGTGLSLRLNTRRPVDLGETFIEDRGWSFLNVVCERLQEGGLKVKDHCLHTGDRRPGRALRTMIENLLPDMAGPLVIDFESVERAASSFLDEVLGRLAAAMGPEDFAHRIQIRNAPESLLRMANAVIRQRLEGVRGE